MCLKLRGEAGAERAAQAANAVHYFAAQLPAFSASAAMTKG
jgi:hypothetical protein